ncbi:hypothetical protein [Methylomonas fluvii]|uniref:Uncharacterized protein n=1 Tax=Methylomonas fluvii TaxID=1854564 RepID=A0ABR9DEF1_9GAMM|nr:hypothetical protein [Methylomonas fluvii]MBD9361473.1 hypothetical protein [Methylomonas fluvii]
MNTALKIFQNIAGIAEGHANQGFDEITTNGITVINMAGKIFRINALRILLCPGCFEK